MATVLLFNNGDEKQALQTAIAAEGHEVVTTSSALGAINIVSGLTNRHIQLVIMNEVYTVYTDAGDNDSDDPQYTKRVVKAAKDANVKIATQSQQVNWADHIIPLHLTQEELRKKIREILPEIVQPDSEPEESEDETPLPPFFKP